MKNSDRQYEIRFVEWLKVKGYSQRTIDDYKCYTCQFIKFMERETSVEQLQEVDGDTIYSYQNYLYHSKSNRGKRLSLESQARKLMAIKRLFDFLIEIDVALINPAAGIKLPQTSKKKLPKGVMSEKQVELLLDQVDTSTAIGFRNRTIMEVLYASAIRNSELRRLSVYDVDTEQFKLTVLNGKGSKDRVVPIGEIACNYVREYVKVIRPKLVGDNADQKLMFVSKHGNEITRANLIWMVNKYAKKCNDIPKGVGPHSFRHSCATHMLRHGADIRYVQKMLGHASVATTQIYTNVDESDLKAVHRRCHPRELL